MTKMMMRAIPNNQFDHNGKLFLLGLVLFQQVDYHTGSFSNVRIELYESIYRLWNVIHPIFYCIDVTNVTSRVLHNYLHEFEGYHQRHKSKTIPMEFKNIDAYRELAKKSSNKFNRFIPNKIKLETILKVSDISLVNSYGYYGSTIGGHDNKIPDLIQTLDYERLSYTQIEKIINKLKFPKHKIYNNLVKDLLSGKKDKEFNYLKELKFYSKIRSGLSFKSRQQLLTAIASKAAKNNCDITPILGLCDRDISLSLIHDVTHVLKRKLVVSIKYQSNYDKEKDTYIYANTITVSKEKLKNYNILIKDYKPNVGGKLEEVMFRVRKDCDQPRNKLTIVT